MARPDELPEGTDHIINGAMATEDDQAGGEDGGFVAPAGGDGTGGTAQSGGGTAMAKTQGGAGGNGGSGGGSGGSGGGDASGGGGGSGGGEGGGGVREQLTSQVQALRGQAGDRVREFADGGKTRASDALEELSRVVAESADTIDERLGGQYGEYARKASDAVSGFADTLRRTEIDDLYENVRGAVRKSPGVAIGIAAVVGFTLVRLAKAGLEAEQGGKAGGADGSGGGSQAGGAGA